MQYFETVLGAQNMIYAKWLVAFAVVLILAIVLLRLLRGLMGSSLNMSERGSGRGRVPRLGVTEFFNLDKQGRRLVIVRRDNVEHLVLIGGPNDVLIESSIVRADRSGAPRIEPRDTATNFGRAEEAQPRLETPQPRQVPGLQAPQDAPEPRPAPLPLGDRQPVVDIPREDLALRLEEVLRKPVTPRAPEPAPLAPPAPVQVPHPIPTPTPARPSTPQRPPEPVLRTPEPPRPPEPVRPVEPPRRPEPRIFADPILTPEPSAAETTPAAEAPNMPAPEVKPPEPRPVEPKTRDVLSSILKPRPAESLPTPPEPPAPSEPAKPAEAAKPLEPAPAPPPPAAPIETPPPAPAAPPPQPKNPFDSLEEEMARLLGRGLGDKQ